MARMKIIEGLVQEALTNNINARKDNFILYIEVLQHYIDTNMSINKAFNNHIALGIPSLESITRCRRRVQERNPELRDEAMDEVRRQEQADILDYVRGK